MITGAPPPPWRCALTAHALNAFIERANVGFPRNGTITSDGEPKCVGET